MASQNPNQLKAQMLSNLGHRRFGQERLESASPMTQLSRNLSGATLASVTKDGSGPREVLPPGSSSDATPVLFKKASTKYSKVCTSSSSGSSVSEDDASPEDSRSPRKLLDFAESPSDCPKDDFHEQMETSRENIENEMSPDCRALLSPRGPVHGLKRKFPESSPGGSMRSLLSHISPRRVFGRSPRKSPTKRTRLLSFFGPENSASQSANKLAASAAAGLVSRPPLRAIQSRGSNDFVFTPPTGLPPKRILSPSVSRSPVLESPTASSDGYSEFLTLDEDTNLPPALPSSSASLNLSNLLKGSILSTGINPSPKRRITNENIAPRDLSDRNKAKDDGLERMETDDAFNKTSSALTSSNPTTSRVPLRRALSYAGRTPMPRTGPTKSAKTLFGNFLADSGSPFLASKSVNDENAPPASTSSSSSSSSSSSLQWDTESCPPPFAKTRRLLLHSVSEESEDSIKDSPRTVVDSAITMPPDLNALRERSSNLIKGGVSLTHFRSESNLSARTLRRSTSDTHAIINRALKRSESRPNLIADCTRPYCLPIVSDGVKHPDLKNISPDTMAKVLRGEYSNVITKFTIIDARFPYEFNGGHIEGALNIYTKDQILDDILPNEPCQANVAASVIASSASCADVTPDSSPDDGKPKQERNIIIFHCEFSSERAPSLLRFLRSRDRGLNEENYPALHFPELYLLEGGYKAFFESHPDLCAPSGYRTMLDPKHTEDLRHFKAKAKTWSGDPLATGFKNVGALGGGLRRKPSCKKHL